MKETIKTYTVKGREVRVVKYTEDDRVVYHVEYDIPEYQKNCYWYYGECGKVDAIRSAQFVAGCIERDSYFK